MQTINVKNIAEKAERGKNEEFILAMEADFVRK